MRKLKLIILYPLLVLVLGALAAAGAAWYWAEMRPVSMDASRIDYIVEPGSSPRAIARRLNMSGITVHEDGLVALARITGMDKGLKAGAYEAQQGDTPMRLLQRMADGDMSQTRLTLVEGWTYRRIRATLAQNPDVRQTLEGVSDAELLERLGSKEKSPEGLFYPDTYVFAPGTSDYDILRRAYHAQQMMMDNLWEQREPGLPLASPYEALILASIIEKETGHSEDRGRVAGVFVNRLRAGMPLQTDPTVIYGMGDAYKGQIRKKDLTTDTPWNTYTRGGLPPTPIASPGKASFLAVLHPEKHDFLYFVSRGDGRSEFSVDLAAHNRAVSKYILRRN